MADTTRSARRHGPIGPAWPHGLDILGEGVVLGLVLGIGFAAAHTLVDANFDPNKPQPWTWFAITAAYNAIGLLIVAVLVAIWR